MKVQVTAVGLLRASAVPKGEWLMLTAAGSSIGRQIIQIGKSYSLNLIAIVRRSEDRPELLRLGWVLKLTYPCLSLDFALQLHTDAHAKSKISLAPAGAFPGTETKALATQSDQSEVLPHTILE